jgi:hypothetical protein
MDECLPHKGLCLLPLPQSVMKGTFGPQRPVVLITGIDILRKARRWVARQYDLVPDAAVLLDIIDRDPVVCPEGEFTPVSLRERDLVAHLLEEASYAWEQDALGEFLDPTLPEWAEHVHKHVDFYATCAYQQGWLT